MMSFGTVFCSEPAQKRIIPDGYKMIQRPVGQALMNGFFKGGRNAFIFTSPILFFGIAKNHTADEALGAPLITGLLSAVSGGVLAGVSSMLPMKKEDIGKELVRQKFINRAGAVGAHTGTFFGALMLALCAIFNSTVKY